MVLITEHLIRRKAEHNECIISTLEEISLHQEDIERIEYIDKWCKDLRILYLQSNLIPRIENVSKLKKLEYLNLALNNVEIIENLEGCESLKKLDLTVNFVGVATSVETLKDLVHFRELFLTGNPCTEYVGYRDYVIATLPQLKYLDGIEIEKSERIKAVQQLHEIRPSILQQQQVYKKKREKQKKEEELKDAGEKVKNKANGSDWYTDINSDDKKEEPEASTDQEIDKDKEFWEEKVAYTPESRIKVHEHMKEQRKREERKSDGPETVKKERRLQTDDGRILNFNDAQVDFTLTEDDDHQNILLDVAIFKHMDTSLCDVDVQPTYVRVTLKGKVLQLALSEEVKPDSSSAKRSQTTGHLLISMPKASPMIKPNTPPAKSKKSNAKESKENQNPSEKQQSKSRVTQEKLEVDPSSGYTVDVANIVKEKSAKVTRPLGSSYRGKAIEERPNSPGFVDDPDVPPLE